MAEAARVGLKGESLCTGVQGRGSISHDKTLRINLRMSEARAVCRHAGVPTSVDPGGIERARTHGRVVASHLHRVSSEDQT